MGKEYSQDIEKRMKIKPLPKAPLFVGMLNEEQLKVLKDDEIPLAMAMSQIQQHGAWMAANLENAIDQAREAEAELLEKLSDIKKGFWFLVGTIVVAAVSHYFKVL